MRHRVLFRLVEHERRLRGLAINDDKFVESVLRMDSDELEATGPDPKTQALTRLAAMLALDSSASCYQASVNAAYAAGSTTDEIVGVLIAVGPVIGATRVVSAAPELGLALGFDVDAALEQP